MRVRATSGRIVAMAMVGVATAGLGHAVMPDAVPTATSAACQPGAGFEQYWNCWMQSHPRHLITAPPAISSTPTPGAATGPLGPGGVWKVGLADEFNGSALNPAVWSTGWFGSGITQPVNSAELQCYDPAQVVVGGGVLALSAVARQETCGGKTRAYASGMVSSNAKYEFRYGFAESRIWLPGSTQLTDWPAFWADGHNWPVDGEIDVMEGLGGSACWHFHYPGGGPGGCAPGNFAGGWHTYGADWEPGAITFYYDGAVVGRQTAGVTAAPMYLMLNLALDPSIGGPNQTPAAMRVDYVRVWHH
jgi:beta-glucanase (GH16 family)